jgi:hypothetical protein
VVECIFANNKINLLRLFTIFTSYLYVFAYMSEVGKSLDGNELLNGLVCVFILLPKKSPRRSFFLKLKCVAPFVGSKSVETFSRMADTAATQLS